MLKEYLDLSNLFWTGWNTCISMLFPLHKQSENPWVRYYLSKTWSCSRIYSMLVFGSCFLGPRQLVVRKVNVLYYTLHSKRNNLKCQKWPAVINWTWVLTFRRCLYRIWLHFKILATLQFLFKIRTTWWERFSAKFASTIKGVQTKKDTFIWTWKASLKKTNFCKHRFYNGILLPKLFWLTVRKIVLVIEKNSSKIQFTWNNFFPQ